MPGSRREPSPIAGGSSVASILLSPNPTLTRHVAPSSRQRRVIADGQLGDESVDNCPHTHRYSAPTLGVAVLIRVPLVAARPPARGFGSAVWCHLSGVICLVSSLAPSR